MIPQGQDNYHNIYYTDNVFIFNADYLYREKFLKLNNIIDIVNNINYIEEQPSTSITRYLVTIRGDKAKINKNLCDLE